ncbi:MAG: hypothetical protein K2L74_06365, partial [Muribaculaceae bacterium]|nr:hypothetical protein [Muribaculaceae bacterium]
MNAAQASSTAFGVYCCARTGPDATLSAFAFTFPRRLSPGTLSLGLAPGLAGGSGGGGTGARPAAAAADGACAGLGAACGGEAGAAGCGCGCVTGAGAAGSPAGASGFSCPSPLLAVALSGEGLNRALIHN